MIPAFLQGVDDALVVLDWSGVTHSAWHRVGPEGLLRAVAADLLALVADPCPPRLVRAVDAGLPTHRHAMTEHLEPKARYKGQRVALPRDFYLLCDRLDRLVEELRIPTLWPANFEPQTWEADDAAAAACARARAAGLPVVLLSADKDWRQSVTDEAPRVTWWDGKAKALDVAGVIGEHGVPPALLGDWLALVGDTSDNVPGAEGLGPTKATALIKAWGTVEKMLATEPASPEALAEMEKALTTLRRERDKTKRAFGDTAEIERTIAAKKSERDLWTWHRSVHALRIDVELSRRLVALRADVAIDLDLDEALVGGWSVDRVRRALEDLGIGYLGREVQPRKKRGRKVMGAAVAPEVRDGVQEVRSDGARGGRVPSDVQEGVAGRGGGEGHLAGAQRVDGERRDGRPVRDPAEDLGPARGGDERARVAPATGPGSTAHAETALCRGMLDRARTGLSHISIAYLIEDLRDPKRLPHADPAVRAEVLAALEAMPHADLRRKGAA